MMSEPTTVTDEHARKLEGRGTESPVAAGPAPEELVEVELLLEDVSIDGLCGVY